MDKGKEKKAYSRSRVYPRYSLDQAIAFVRLVDRLGGKDVLQQTLMAELGKKSPNDPIFTGKVSSAKQFGLLEVGKQGYSLTEKARLLLYPPPGTDEQQILKEAFITPAFYEELINRFNGKELPAKMSLGNLLFNQFGIARNAKNRAANVFIKSAEHAGVLVDGYLKADLKGSSTAGTGREKPEEVAPEGYIDLKLPVTGGEVRIIAPKSIKNKEIEALTATLKAFNEQEDSKEND